MLLCVWIIGSKLVRYRTREMRETESVGVDEKCDIEEEIEKEDEGDYFARWETHKKRRGRWEVTTVDDPVKGYGYKICV